MENKNLERKYSRTHIGKTFATNENLGAYEVKVIDGGVKALHCLIEFTGSKLQLEVIYQHVKNGTIKNPLHPVVANIGFTGVGNYRSKDNKLAYRMWQDMLLRCYDSVRLDRRKTYRGVTVDPTWFNYQTFMKFLDKATTEANMSINDLVNNYSLDKDLKVHGNKIYSEQTTIFISRDLNIFLTNNRITNSSGYIGVHAHGPNWRAEFSVGGRGKRKREGLGTYKTKTEAFKTYMAARWKRIDELRIEGLLIDAFGNSLYDEMINWQIAQFAPYIEKMFKKESKF